MFYNFFFLYLGNATTGEYCCDLFSSLKENVLEALEKEFTCCICNEMFVGVSFCFTLHNYGGNMINVIAGYGTWNVNRTL